MPPKGWIPMGMCCKWGKPFRDGTLSDDKVSRNRSILEERILAKSLELQIDRYVVHEETVNVAEIIVLDIHMVEKIVNLF
jgi:hypothetical protein